MSVSTTYLNIKCFFFLILTRGHAHWFQSKGKGRRERERETPMWERNIYQLLLLCSPTRDQTHNLSFCFKEFIYLFLERGREGEREKRNINVWLLLAHPLLGTRPGPQPRPVPWLRIETATLWFAGRHSIHWATPARADLSF